ncbi:b-box zinc finger domain-containing protein, partial [Cystoisospora suis]
MMEESSSAAPDDYGYPSLASQSSLASLTPPSLLLPPSSSVLSSSAAEGLLHPFSGFSSASSLRHHHEQSPSSSSYSASSLSNEEDRLSRQSQLTIDGSQALVDASSSKEAPSGACCPREVTCSVCRRKVEDLLLLSCSHHLCLVCACHEVLKKDERLLSSNKLPRRYPRGGGEEGEALACPICHVPTRLSASTLSSLRRLKGRSDGGDHAYGRENAEGVEEGFVFDNEYDQEDEEEGVDYDENLRRLFPGRMSILRLRDEEKGKTARKKDGDHNRRRRRVVLYERGGQGVEDDKSEDAGCLLPPGGVPVRRRKHDEEDGEERGNYYLCCECEGHEASVFCKGCVRNYCDVCAVRVHEGNPRFKSHQFRSLLQSDNRRLQHTSSFSSSSTSSLSSSLLHPGEDQERTKSGRRRRKAHQAPDGLLLPLGGPAITERVKLRGTNHIKSFQDTFLDLPGGDPLSHLSSSFFFPSSSIADATIPAGAGGVGGEGGEQEEKASTVKKTADDEGSSVNDLSTHTSAIDDHVMG